MICFFVMVFSLKPAVVLDAVLQTECLATPTHEAIAQEVEVGEEVEDVAKWGFDE